MAIFQSSWDAASAAGGGVGENGTWTYDSGAAGLTFGTVNPGDTKEISFTGLDDGDVYVPRLVFSGTGTAAFQVSRVTRNGVTDVLDTPFPCNVTGGDFTMATDEPAGGGATFAIQFSTVYTDGTAETMTVEIYNGATLVATVTATATVDDPWVGQVKLQGSAMGAWARASGSSGDIAPDAAAFVDLAGVGGPDFIAKIATLGNWAFDDSEGPAATGVLANCVTTKTNRGNSNFGAVDAALPGDVLSGQMILRVVTPQTSGQRVAMFATMGIDSDPLYGFLGPGFPDSPECFQWNDTVVSRKRQRFADYPGDHPITHSDTTSWVTVSWRCVVDRSTDWDVTLSTVGAAFGDIGTVPGGASQWFAADGFRSFYNQNGTGDTSTGTVKLAGFALFSGDIGQVALEALHDAVIP